MSVYLQAGAKVNLLLRVLGKDDGGYHLLRSLVAFTDFGDDLWLEAVGDKDEVIWQGASSVIGDVPSTNILLSVLGRVRDYISLPYFRIEVLKRIPMGGGLGGGSSDAAVLLNHLVEAYGLGRGDAITIANELGSDIVVCMGGVASWVGGTGGEVVKLGHFPKGVYCLLVSCGVGLSTGAVFGRFGGGYSGDLGMVDGFGSYGDLLNYLGRLGGNDLWGCAVDLCDSLEVLRDEMVELDGIDYVGMSGSGSVMFGLFWDYDFCVRSCNLLLDRGYFAVVAELR